MHRKRMNENFEERDLQLKEILSRSKGRPQAQVAAARETHKGANSGGKVSGSGKGKSDGRSKGPASRTASPGGKGHVRPPQDHQRSPTKDQQRHLVRPTERTQVDRRKTRRGGRSCDYCALLGFREGIMRSRGFM